MEIHPSSGVKEAFAKAYEEHAQAIFRYCYFHTFQRELAKELMQETFLKAWEYLREGNSIRNIRAFLFKVAVNLVINAARRKREVSLEALAEGGFDVVEEEEAHRRDFIAEERVLSVLRKIEEPYRTALTLGYLEGLSPGEIGKITGETPNAISVRMHRGLKLLRAQLRFRSIKKKASSPQRTEIAV